MPENTIVSKTFTYDLPDDYLSQTSELGLTGTFTYEGPDKVWIFVDDTTGHPASGLYYTEDINGADVPTPTDQIKVLVTADREPEIISLITGNMDYSGLPQKDEALPDGSVYSRCDPTPPDHTYEFEELQYDVTADPNGGHWIKPLPWKKPFTDWDQLKAARNGLLAMSDDFLANTPTLTDAKRAEWETYRQALRDLPVTFDGIEAHKVPFPAEPGE